MQISLTTSGGITGRGLGAIAIDGIEVVVDRSLHSALSHEDRDRLMELMPTNNAVTREPSGRPDAITYNLQVDRRQWCWDDLSEPSAELIAFSDELLRIRDRILGQTSFSSGSPLP